MGKTFVVVYSLPVQFDFSCNNLLFIKFQMFNIYFLHDLNLY